VFGVSGIADVRALAGSAGAAGRRAWVGWVPLIALPAGACALRARVTAWGFMWLLSFVIFWGCKFETWYRARASGARGGAGRNLGYLFLWPGMDAASFLEARGAAAMPGWEDWVSAWAKTIAGAACLWAIVPRAMHVNALLGGWAGMLGIILMLHFGTFHLVALGWQAAGVNAPPIMQSPLSAQSLSEFWGRRWNLGFRQLTHGFVFNPLRRRFGLMPATLAAFLVSGLIHDFVISFPARGGYGLPTAYFVGQGIGVLVEKSALGRRLGIREGFRGWLFVLGCVGGPAFWLFHPVFVTRVVVPFLGAMGARR
jgi:Membrane bound O-acyl transferase family